MKSKLTDPMTGESLPVNQKSSSAFRDTPRRRSAKSGLTNQQQEPQTRMPPTTLDGRFIRTPEKVTRDLTDDEGPALYLVHSIPSRRNAPDGVTFGEIMADHTRQALTDGVSPPLANWMVVHWLGILLRVNLVERIRD